MAFTKFGKMSPMLTGAAMTPELHKTATKTTTKANAMNLIDAIVD